MKNQKCYLSYTYGTPIDNILEILSENNISTVSQQLSRPNGEGMADSVRTAIQKCSLFIAISDKKKGTKPLLLLELGMAIAFGKPILLIGDWSSSTPSILGQHIYLNLDLNERDALRLHLTAYIKNAGRKRPPRATKSKSYDFKPKQFSKIHLVNSAFEVEKLIAEVLSSENIEYQIQQSHEEPDVGRPDMAIWLDDLSTNIKNPVILEIKNSSNEHNYSSARNQVRDYLLKSGLQIGFVVLNDEIDLSQCEIEPTFPLVIPINLSKLLHHLNDHSLARIITNFRNMVAHGGEPSW